jgi:hypothetical protein
MAMRAFMQNEMSVDPAFSRLEKSGPKKVV